MFGDRKPLHEQILSGDLQYHDHIMTVAVMLINQKKDEERQ